MKTRSKTVAETTKRTVALAGNPNSGKTTLFNALTGLRQKVGNYPGVTVERKLGRLGVDGVEWDVLDLPGAYSLTARSPEEMISRNVLLGEVKNTPRPDVVVIVVDASNLDRNLYLACQILDMGLPSMVALNMMDVAESGGMKIDSDALEKRLGVPVVSMVASRGEGVDALKARLAGSELAPPPKRQWTLDAPVEKAIEEAAKALQAKTQLPAESCDSETIRLIGGEGTDERVQMRGGAELQAAIGAARTALEAAGLSPSTFEAERRYGWIRSVTREAVQKREEYAKTRSDQVDAVLTHRLVGPVVFLGLMTLVFQAIFAWAVAPMDWIDAAVSGFGAWIGSLMPEGALRGLIVDGVIAGVGSVVIFLPQILFLFFFIGMLEDTGYMARVAFMMDKLMRRVGLHGKAFIPLLSSFACAIPGIMATRTIENRRDRLVTILIAPLMTCSARLPVYTLLIGAFIPGSAQTKALAMTALYLLGVGGAVGMAWLLKTTILKGETPPLILEMPPYRWPSLKTILLRMWDRSGMFLRRAGTIIMGVTILLWFFASYPKLPAERADDFNQQRANATAEQMTEIDRAETTASVRHSVAGRIGKAIEPVMRPLGYDWRIGVGILASFAAREVFVGAMGTIYGVGEVDDDTTTLQTRLKSATWESGPNAGSPIYTLPTAVGLLIFYVFALQCVSTVAIIRRETNSLRWPAFAWTYMAALAYVASWVARTITQAFI